MTSSAALPIARIDPGTAGPCPLSGLAGRKSRPGQAPDPNPNLAAAASQENTMRSITASTLALALIFAASGSARATHECPSLPTLLQSLERKVEADGKKGFAALFGGGAGHKWDGFAWYADKKETSKENPRFVLSVAVFKHVFAKAELAEAHEKAMEIYNHYVAAGSKEELNIKQGERDDCLKAIKGAKKTEDVLEAFEIPYQGMLGHLRNLSHMFETYVQKHGLPEYDGFFRMITHDPKYMNCTLAVPANHKK
jgi:hypothetical protein